jgi:FkbM family methyltransferase
MEKHIIQIGACGGKDHVTESLTRPLANTTIHLIEPLDNNFAKLQINYKNIAAINQVIFYKCAISTFTGKIPLYCQKNIRNPNNLDEHCSISYDHLLAHGHQNNIEKIEADCYTLNDFIDKFNIKGIIDYLYIDTEGHDCDILLSINFDNLDINNIFFEQVHSDGPFSKGRKLEQTISYLTSHNYTIKQNSGFDILFTKQIL